MLTIKGDLTNAYLVSNIVCMLKQFTSSTSLIKKFSGEVLSVIASTLNQFHAREIVMPTTPVKNLLTVLADRLKLTINIHFTRS
jgi:hypothetical protein